MLHHDQSSTDKMRRSPQIKFGPKAAQPLWIRPMQHPRRKCPQLPGPEPPLTPNQSGGGKILPSKRHHTSASLGVPGPLGGGLGGAITSGLPGGLSPRHAADLDTLLQTPDQMDVLGPTWCEDEHLLAMVFNGFPHAPVSTSQEGTDCALLARLVGRFVEFLSTHQAVRASNHTILYLFLHLNLHTGVICLYLAWPDCRTNRIIVSV